MLMLQRSQLSRLHVARKPCVIARQQLRVKAVGSQLELVSSKQRGVQAPKVDFRGQVYVTFRWPAQLGGKEVLVVGRLLGDTSACAFKLHPFRRLFSLDLPYAHVQTDRNEKACLVFHVCSQGNGMDGPVRLSYTRIQQLMTGSGPC